MEAVLAYSFCNKQGRDFKDEKIEENNKGIKERGN